MSHKSDGVRATNREFQRHDQVDKPQEYRLAEQGRDERYDEDYRIRTCDLGRFIHGDPTDRRRFADELGEALEDIGFAILENTGVDPALYDEAEDRVAELFESTPLEQKLRFRAERFGSVNQGYFPIKETSEIHPDLVEGWVFCRRAFALDAGSADRRAEFWPDPSQEPFYRGIVQQHEALILPIMQGVLTYLGADPHLYDQRLTGTNFGLRLNYYPPVGERDDASGAGRLLGHEDVDLFTLLPAPRVEGLQVLNRHNGKWVRLTAPRGTMILNTGDYMQRITNDRLPSTTHRVSKPRERSMLGRARASIPMAVYLWERETLEVLPGLGEPRYEPTTAIAFHTRCTSKFYGDDYAVDADKRTETRS